MPSTDETLETLEKKSFSDESLRRLNIIRESVIRLWGESEIEQYPYTPHDINHCKQVEELFFKLIPLNKFNEKFTEEERFLLIASAWLHDVGMNPDLYKEDTKNETNIFNLNNKDKLAKWNKSVRAKHAERSARYVRERYLELGLTESESQSLQKMCKLHRQKTYKELDQEPWKNKENIKIQLLIAYLRLADALHIPRKDERKFKTFEALGLDSISRLHWFKSRYVSRVEINIDNYTIIIILKEPDPNTYFENWDEKLEPLKEMLIRMVEDELDPIKEILAKGGISYFSPIVFRFEINRDLAEDDVNEFRELLNNMELWDITLTPNATSVINTTIKQLELFIDKNDSERSIEYIEDYCKNTLKEVTETRPCHIFLWKVRNALDEWLKALAPVGDKSRRIESIIELEKSINNLKIKRKNALDELMSTAHESILKDWSPPLLYGYSDTIVACIRYTFNKSKNDIEIYICEGKTKTEHRYNNRLIYCDGLKYAEKLKEVEQEFNKKMKEYAVNDVYKRHNIEIHDPENLEIRNEIEEEYKAKARYIKIYMVPDSSVSNLFSRRIVNRVLFGANGIGRSGMVSHTLGHLSIADLANISLYRIPVYVFADTMKVGELHVDRDLQRTNSWLTTDVKFESLLDDLYIFNPREDIVPPEKITSFITEKGAKQPTDIARFADEKLFESSIVGVGC